MKLKKALAALTSAITVASGASAIYASAAVPPSTSPRIYVDFVEEDDGDIRADIIFENVPSICSGGFHVNFGSGWNIPYNTFNGIDRPLHLTKGTASDAESFVCYMNYDYGFFVAFANTDFNLDYNGVFLSVYIEKDTYHVPSNSTAEVSFESGDYLTNATQTQYYETTLNNPVMLQAGEYMVGDVTGDGYFTATDSSAVMNFVSTYGVKSVHSIRYSYINSFPNAICADCADADGDGYITNTDAQLIINAYAANQVGHTWNSDVGSINYYELYQ